MRPSLFFATSLTFSPHPLLRRGVGGRAAVRASLSSSLRAAFATTRRGDGTVVIAPEDESEHTASVILCHGLGDTAEGWTDPAQYLASKLPHVKFILPTAPTQPVTLNMGMSMPSWYDIVGLDSRSNEVCNGLDDSVDRIMALLEEEVGSGPASPDYSRTVLAGFSQDGALALYAGLTQHRRGSDVGLGLAGIVLMSGYLPRASQLKIAAGSENTPILHCHGTIDAVVPVQGAELSQARVSELAKEMGGDGGLYSVKTYPGLDHSVSMEELDDVVSFLRQVVPPVTEADVDVNTEGGCVNPSQMSTRELRDAIRRAGLDREAKGMLEKSELVDLLSRHLEESNAK